MFPKKKIKLKFPFSINLCEADNMSDSTRGENPLLFIFNSKLRTFINDLIFQIIMNQLILDTEREAPIELVGGKARGILRLKSLEEKLNEEVVYLGKVIVPRFFIVPSSINLAGSSQEILGVADSLGSEKYAVRSSSALEDDGEHSFDGIFETYLDVPRDKLVRTIHQVRRSARSEKVVRYADEIGAELQDKIPVIVQAMVDKKEHTGVVYSKFPAPRDIVKIIRESAYDGERYIEAFPREYIEDGIVFPDTSNPVVVSRNYSTLLNNEVENLASIALFAERELKYPIIMEFVTYNDSGDWQYNLLQARKLTRLSESEKFQMPELQDKGLIASTYDLNGTGDFTGDAFLIIHDYDVNGVDIDGLEEFDKNHPEGYVLVTPYLQFYCTHLDNWTPNKRAVVAYTDLGEHHDMEVSRKKGILYFNAKNSLSHPFYRGGEHEHRYPIETGERLRVVSDGEKGFIFNLSRE